MFLTPQSYQFPTYQPKKSCSGLFGFGNFGQINQKKHLAKMQIIGIKPIND